MPTRSSRRVPVASRVNRFSYAIRNIVAEAKAVEAAGRQVRYLNIGDPVAFGFQPGRGLGGNVGRDLQARAFCTLLVEEVPRPGMDVEKVQHGRGTRTECLCSRPRSAARKYFYLGAINSPAFRS